MWLVAGLGNPGKTYINTRHNVGFNILDLLANKYNVKFKKTKIAKKVNICVNSEELLLIKPLLYMNMSGIVIKEILKQVPVKLENIIVVHDDLDMVVGKIRIKRGGSSGGHKGVESIIQNLGTKDFIRIKIGIGRDRNIPPEEYVLSKFTQEDSRIIKDAVCRAVEAIETVVTDGVDFAMNKFN